MKDLAFISRICSSVLGFLIAVITGCVSTGPVNSEIDLNRNQVVAAPTDFQSPIKGTSSLLEVSQETMFKEVRDFSRGAVGALLTQQDNIKKELSSSGRLKLEPGHSYEFTLEAFCVHAGATRPVVGDGLFLDNIEGAPKKWLPQLLSSYHNMKISQNDAQLLIWSLLSGSRFDELSPQNQKNLLKIFPDAAVKFGNSVVEEKAKDFIMSQMPQELLGAKDKFDDYKRLLQDTRLKFEEIEQVLSPLPKRANPISVGWLKTEDGYFINLISNGYSEVQVKIYAPENLRAGTFFEPSNKIALPGEGQRLGLSNQVVGDLDNLLGDIAGWYVKYKTGQTLTDAEKNLIIKYPLDASKIGKAMSKASLKTGDIFGKKFLHNTKADAFRHFIWSGLSAESVGPDLALRFLSAHEDFKKNTLDERSMDMHNNHRGVDFFKSYSGSNFENDLVKEGIRQIEKGELKWFL